MKAVKLKTKPNILIINSDQQRFDTLSCYGNNWIKTPNLNSLAKDSFVFENAYVTQPVCAPSRASILTGLYPHTHGAVGNGIRLNSGTKTITELIPDEYQKICHGKWHHTEPQQGFEKMTTAHFPQIERNDYSDLSDYHKWLISKGVNFPDTNKVEENQQVFAVFQNNLPEELTQASFISEVTSKVAPEALPPTVTPAGTRPPVDPNGDKPVADKPVERGADWSTARAPLLRHHSDH